MSAPTYEVRTVGQLREQLSRYDDDAPIECQVCGEESGVWKVFLEVLHGNDCGFNWSINPLLMRLSHPDLLHLLTDEDVNKKLSEQLCKIARLLAEKGL